MEEIGKREEGRDEAERQRTDRRRSLAGLSKYEGYLTLPAMIFSYSFIGLPSSV